jgi:hypothetical protein
MSETPIKNTDITKACSGKEEVNAEQMALDLLNKLQKEISSLKKKNTQILSQINKDTSKRRSRSRQRNRSRSRSRRRDRSRSRRRNRSRSRSRSRSRRYNRSNSRRRAPVKCKTLNIKRYHRFNKNKFIPFDNKKQSSVFKKKSKLIEGDLYLCKNTSYYEVSGVLYEKLPFPEIYCLDLDKNIVLDANCLSHPTLTILEKIFPSKKNNIPDKTQYYRSISDYLKTIHIEQIVKFIMEIDPYNLVINDVAMNSLYVNITLYMHNYLKPEERGTSPDYYMEFQKRYKDIMCIIEDTEIGNLINHKILLYIRSLYRFVKQKDATYPFLHNTFCMAIAKKEYRCYL